MGSVLKATSTYFVTITPLAWSFCHPGSEYT